MHLDVESPVLALEPGQLLVLDDAAGTRIVSRRGTVWVTEEGLADDRIVSAGGSLVVARPGRTLVQAMDHACIALQ
ncbi:MAG TPA: DUF2917 domain-containing protein [Usitatibacter sp.]|nr:DUF2917 domain-containing protein [Usitatibacter sp.]